MAAPSLRLFNILGLDDNMSCNPLMEKSLSFAVRIIKLNEFLNSRKEYTISKQIVRSGTSIGANISEANFAQSKSDFVSKMHIALKETAETIYWLELLKRAEYITCQLADSLLDDCTEIKRLLVSTLNTSKGKAE